MTHYQDDKYENFMANIRAARPVLAAFADFTVAAVGAAGVDALLTAQLPGLTAARAAFQTSLVTRTTGSGRRQTGTSSEDTAFAAFKAFIKDTDTRHLQPYFLDHPAEGATFYPDKLGGLTQAPKPKRLSRLTAYTQALEAAPPPAQAAAGSALPPTLGAQARALLVAYAAADAVRTSGRTTLQDTIASLGPDAVALAEALWDVHTAALFVHRRDPQQARKYFDYASLPGRSAAATRAAKAKAKAA